MSRLLRLGLICIIAAALPLKGVMAATRGACDAAEHSTAPALTDHEAPAAKHVHLHAHDGAAAASPTSGHAEAESHAADDFKVKCSTCAPCCAAAAPGSEATALVEPDGVTRVGQVAESGYVDITSDLPDRPPRPLLA